MFRTVPVNVGDLSNKIIHKFIHAGYIIDLVGGSSHGLHGPHPHFRDHPYARVLHAAKQPLTRYTCRANRVCARREAGPVQTAFQNKDVPTIALYMQLHGRC